MLSSSVDKKDEKLLSESYQDKVSSLPQSSTLSLLREKWESPNDIVEDAIDKVNLFLKSSFRDPSLTQTYLFMLPQEKMESQSDLVEKITKTKELYAEYLLWNEMLPQTFTSTIPPEIHESQSDVVRKATKTADLYLKDLFQNTFLRVIHQSEFEFGFDSLADEYLQDALNKYGPFAREWTNSLFVDNFDNPSVLVGILRVIAHFDHDQIWPQGLTMAAAALSHIDDEVRECGVRCFENWERPETTIFLRNLQFSDAWMQKYVDDVIAGLEAMEIDVSRC